MHVMTNWCRVSHLNAYQTRWAKKKNTILEQVLFILFSVNILYYQEFVLITFLAFNIDVESSTCGSFAAEVFHGLEEEAMHTCSRSHKLMIRVQKIEAALPPLEKTILAQRSHLHFAYTTGMAYVLMLTISNCHICLVVDNYPFIFSVKKSSH